MIHHTLPHDTAQLDQGYASRYCLSDTSSIYSKQETDDNTMYIRSGTPEILTHNDYHMSDPAQPYREIVADMQMKVWPELYRRSVANNNLVLLESDRSRVTSTSTLSSETPQSMSYLRLPEPALRLTSDWTSKRPKPEKSMQTRYQTNGKPKAVRFQDTPDDLAEPSLESDGAEVMSPLQAEEKSTSHTLLLERSRSNGNVRRTGVHQNASASRSVATSVHEPPKDFLHSEQARSAAKDELPVYRPVKNVPVRRGWVKKVAEAITKRGQNE
jgi:hypothetical protein